MMVTNNGRKYKAPKKKFSHKYKILFGEEATKET
jgi:hypothetical protein